MKLIIKTVAVCTALFILVACGQDQAPDKEAARQTAETITLTSAQLRELGVKLDHVSSMDLSHELRVHGILEVPPQYLLSVNAPLGGIVRKMEILPGEHVKKGTILIQLEGSEFITLQEEYLSVQARLLQAQLELQRQQELAKDNISARRSLEAAVADEHVLRVRRKAIGEQLSLIGIDAGKLTDETLSRMVSIRAPFDGHVTEVFVNTGSAVEPNGKLLEMVDPRHLHVELRVFERDARQVKAEQRLDILIAGESKEREGHIHVVGTEISEDRSILVHGHLDTEDPTLRPGTTLLARIYTDAATSMAVPSGAIVNISGVPHIFIQRSSSEKNGTEVSAISVETGATQDGFTGVRSDIINTNTRVVVEGAHRLRSIVSGAVHDHH